MDILDSNISLVSNSEGNSYIAFENASIHAWDQIGLEFLLAACFGTKEISDVRLMHGGVPWVTYENKNFQVILNPKSIENPNRSFVDSSELDSFLSSKGCPIQDLNRIKLSASYNLMFSRSSEKKSGEVLEFYFRLESLRNSYSKVSSASYMVLRPLRPVPRLEKLNGHTLIQKLVHMREGMLVVAGPTSQGKSTLLSSILQERAFIYPDAILTAENPIEYNLQHIRGVLAVINQYDSLNDHEYGMVGLIKSFLRMRPDVIFVSEVRSSEEVELSIHAQRTKHQIYTTTHADRAWQVFGRLVKQLPPSVQVSELIDAIDYAGALVTQRLIATKKNGVIAIQDIFFFDQESKELLITEVQKGVQETGEFSKMTYLLKEIISQKTSQGLAMTQGVHLKEHYDNGLIDFAEYEYFKSQIVNV